MCEFIEWLCDFFIWIFSFLSWEAISSLATLLAAFATFWTVSEMKRQREASYRPDLSAPDVLIHCSQFYNPNQTPKFTIEYGNENILIFHNLGFGVAKEIQIEWENNYHEIIKLIEIKDTSKEFKFTLNGNTLLMEAWGNMWPRVIGDMQRNSNFLYPDDELSIKIPDTYLLLVTIYAHLVFKEIKVNNKFDFNLPSTTFKISYKDIGGKQYEKRMILLTEVNQLKGIDPIVANSHNIGSFYAGIRDIK